MPRLSDSMEEGTILKWLVAEGDELHEGQPLVEVETDKAIVTHEADGDATVLAILEPEGSSVAVGAPIVAVGQAGETFEGSTGGAASTDAGAQAEAQAETGTKTEAKAKGGGTDGGRRSALAPPAIAARQDDTAPSAARATNANGRVKASPLARRAAAAHNVDLAAIEGTGPHGRVIRSDVERAAAAARTVSGRPLDGDAMPTVGDGAPATGEITRIELTRLQRTVARRMTESRQSVPDIELRVEVDMTEAVTLREQLRQTVDAGELPSLNDFVVKAAGLALRAFPRVNGAYREDALQTHARVNVGIAVAGEDSLVVPTIFDADTRSLGSIARDARALAAKVRDSSIAPAELDGATFSISNLGMFGIDGFAAIINQPQAAILTVGVVRLRPVALESGELVARQTALLSLCCDHRIVYGADGARFLARLRELLERPLSLLL